MKTISYDSIRCETVIGKIRITDLMLAEMGLTLEEFLEKLEQK